MPGISRELRKNWTEKAECNADRRARELALLGRKGILKEMDSREDCLSEEGLALSSQQPGLVLLPCVPSQRVAESMAGFVLCGADHPVEVSVMCTCVCLLPSWGSRHSLTFRSYKPKVPFLPKPFLHSAAHSGTCWAASASLRLGH